MINTNEINELIDYLKPEEQEELVNILSHLDSGLISWTPLPGRQSLAWESQADIIGYGGAAGGGKTDLLVAMAILKHQVSLILRREATQLTGIVDRMRELLGTTDGWNGQQKIWRLPGKRIELGSTPHLDDWTKYQGRPRDFLGIDEAANFLEQQVRSLIGWVRSTDPKQKCTTLMTFNPPTSAEGRWVISFFAPWLDDRHPNPAEPGEIRWFTTVNGEDVEVPDGRPFVIVNGEFVYDFEPNDYKPSQILKPMSRTFIPAKVTDNPYLMDTGYMATLQSLEEPLRSQMLDGDFKAGLEDDAFQLIPTAWLDAAIERWDKRILQDTPMDSLGVDIARGGKDKTVIIKRHGNFIAEPVAIKGTQTPDGQTAVAHIIANHRDNAPIHVDIIGVGSSPYDLLVNANQPVYGINVAEQAEGFSRGGGMRFFNKRSELMWRVREALDPAYNPKLAIPPDRELYADLLTPKWEVRGNKIYVQSREQLVKELGRSADYFAALALALIDTPKVNTRLTYDRFAEDSGCDTDDYNNYDLYS